MQKAGRFFARDFFGRGGGTSLEIGLVTTLLAVTLFCSLPGFGTYITGSVSSFVANLNAV